MRSSIGIWIRIVEFHPQTHAKRASDSRLVRRRFAQDDNVVRPLKVSLSSFAAKTRDNFLIKLRNPNESRRNRHYLPFSSVREFVGTIVAGVDGSARTEVRGGDHRGGCNAGDFSIGDRKEDGGSHCGIESGGRDFRARVAKGKPGRAVDRSGGDAAVAG
jgi:hypothetical protein